MGLLNKLLSNNNFKGVDNSLLKIIINKILKNYEKIYNFNIFIRVVKFIYVFFKIQNN